MKKIIKLINNERINSAVLSNKANNCVGGGVDYCAKEDRASCSAYADDTCTYDYYSYNCYGISTEDACYIDSE